MANSETVQFSLSFPAINTEHFQPPPRLLFFPLLFSCFLRFRGNRTCYNTWLAATLKHSTGLKITVVKGLPYLFQAWEQK